MTLADIIALTVTVSQNALDDIWHWFLTNFNTALIITVVTGVSRMLSRREHAQTAAALADARADLALTIARKADLASAKSSLENAGIVAAIAENTVISSQAADGAERAFHEANSVNTKIEHLHDAQLALQSQQNNMQSDRDGGA